MVFISLIINDFEDLFMCLGHLHVFCGEMSTSVYCLYLGWVVNFSDFELHELFVNVGDRSLVSSIVSKYFLPFKLKYS